MHSERAVFDQGSGHRVRPGGDATATVSLRGIITGWSEGARQLLGYRAPEVVGRDATDLLATADRAGATGFSLIDSQEWSGAAALRHRDGHRLDLTLHAYPSLDSEGRIQGFLVTVPTDSSEEDQSGSGPGARSEYDRRIVEWAFAQSSVSMATFANGGTRWRRLNAPAPTGIEADKETGEEARTGGRPVSPYPDTPDIANTPDAEEVLNCRDVPGEDWAEEGFLRQIRRVAEEGTPRRYEHLAPASAASPQRACIVEMWPVRDPSSGKVCGVGTATFDSTEQHWARQRLALLNEAGANIGTTLNMVRTAEELAELAVPRLADFVSVDLLDSVLHGDEPVPGPVDAAVVMRRVTHRSTTEGVPEAAVHLGDVDTYPPFSPPARCLAIGAPVLSGAGDPDFQRWIAEKQARGASVRRYGFHSLVAAPLRARGITLGVAVFVRGRASPAFAQDDLVLAEELARRTAVGVDNARRYTRERTNALTLQSSLLPHTLPKQAAVDAAFRYLPAGSRAGVGGDWFDVIPLSGTRVALVVGDVIGHGLHASATMGRLRTAVHTLANVDLPPDELLTHLDDLVIHLTSEDDSAALDAPHTGEIGATCLYAVYDPVSRLCTVASAGHPPPAMLLPDGTVSMVRLAAGPMLGVGGMPFEATELEVPEGSLLAFYTNGLIEAHGRDFNAGLDKLREALAAPVPSLEVTCDGILKALLPDSPSDDVALLLVRTHALHADQVATWALPSDPAVVADARAQAARQLTIWGLDDAAYITELVVSELVTNAIRYGDVPIGLRLIRDRTLICEVSDASSTAPHLRRAHAYDEGGRGLALVAQLTQAWGTRQTATGKTIWAEQPLPAGHG